MSRLNFSAFNAPRPVTYSTPARPSAPAGRSAPGTAGSYGSSRYVVVDNQVSVGGTRAWRNNNPGNLGAGQFATGHGAIGSDGRFAIFPDAATGRQALESLLNTSGYSNLTIRDAMQRYAPPSENDSAAYLAHVLQRTGASGDTKLSELTAEQKGVLADTIQQHEGWRPGIVFDGTQSAPPWVQDLMGFGVESAPGEPADAAGRDLFTPLAAGQGTVAAAQLRPGESFDEAINRTLGPGLLGGPDAQIRAAPEPLNGAEIRAVDPNEWTCLVLDENRLAFALSAGGSLADAGMEVGTGLGLIGEGAGKIAGYGATGIEVGKLAYDVYQSPNTAYTLSTEGGGVLGSGAGAALGGWGGLEAGIAGGFALGSIPGALVGGSIGLLGGTLGGGYAGEQAGSGIGASLYSAATGAPTNCPEGTVPMKYGDL